MQRPARLLMVEDERLIALDLQQRVTLLGYTVVVLAVTGTEAIHQALAHRPDLMLMDFRLQGAMDGIEAAAFRRTHLDLPVVYLSAYVDETTLARAHATRPAGYLCKPFAEHDLQHTLARVLGELPPAAPRRPRRSLAPCIFAGLPQTNNPGSAARSQSQHILS